MALNNVFITVTGDHSKTQNVFKVIKEIYIAVMILIVIVIKVIIVTYTYNTNTCNINCNLPHCETFSERQMLPHLVWHFCPQKHLPLWIYSITYKNGIKGREPHQVMFPEVLYFAMTTNPYSFHSTSIW